MFVQDQIQLGVLCEYVRLLATDPLESSHKFPLETWGMLLRTVAVWVVIGSISVGIISMSPRLASRKDA